jgi:hypothetical protein
LFFGVGLLSDVAAKMAAVREQGRQDGCDMINAFVWRSDCNE